MNIAHDPVCAGYHFQNGVINPLRFPANYVGGIVPLALRSSLYSLSARVTIATGISETNKFQS